MNMHIRKSLFFPVTIACLLSGTPQMIKAENLISTIGSVVSNTSSALKTTLYTPKSYRIALVTSAALFFAGMVRLYTKRGNKKEFQWTDLVKIQNILTKEYWDNLVIGEEIKFRKKQVYNQDEDGNKVKYVDEHELKQPAKGILGYIDAYFFKQIKKILEIIKNVDDIKDRTNEFINSGNFFDTPA